MTIGKGEKIYPGIEEEVAVIQAHGTISNIFDALVELITNSDDSYRLLEYEGKKHTGKIDILIKKSKQGFCESIKVKDEANGISPEKIKEIFCYGKPTSGLYQGKSVRGFFGRGLKESILALGSANIKTCCNGKLTHCKYYYDDKEKRLVLEIIDKYENYDQSSFTEITIFCSSEKKLKCYEFDKIYRILNDHFALREINKNRRREIRIMLEKGNKRFGPKRLFYKEPNAQQIVNEQIMSSEYGPVKFILYESFDRLYYSKYDPVSSAGILVKTNGVILENCMFGYENDIYSNYFFGELDCPGFYEKILQGDKSLIRPDRKGIYWQKVQDIEDKVKEILKHHIERKKRKSYESTEEIPQDRKDKFHKVLKKLNILAEEITEPVLVDDGNFPDEQNITRLTIYPSEASSSPDQFRAFSIYAPRIKGYDERIALIALDDIKGDFRLSSEEVLLRPHEKYEQLMYGYFKIKGNKVGDRTIIIVRSNNEEDIAEFKVVEHIRKKAKGKTQPKEKQRGLFKKIVFDSEEMDPDQRVFYDKKSGYIIIYLNFPGIQPNLGKSGNGIETPKGSMLFVELLAEAFCREVSRRKADRDIFDAEGRLDYYLKLYNENLKRCLPIIQKIFLAY
jgi:hypothetical protein